mmetsp:Transcript_40822/g.47073  ORF Transcript_40822/g.47073 Transcript_40822/m.47073 type:complete len:239 (-) Transcript_40822:191-907(-)
MKFTTILFSLAVVATTVMSDDTDNTTDTNTTAAAASSDGEEEKGGFWSGVKEAWGDMKTVLACTSDVTNMYKDDEGLGAAWAAWDNSLKIDESLSTEGGNNTYSYTSAYPADTTAAYKEACEKGEGNIWTAVPDQSFQCRKEGEDKKWNTVNVAVSNNGVCLPGDSENCNSIMADNNFTAADFADNALYEELSSAKDIYCNEMQFDDDETDSGGVVTSTTFIGSVVAATAVLAFTVLI